MNVTHITRFIADLEADLERSLTDPSVFQPLSPEQDRALDTLFAMITPHFKKVLDDAVERGVLVRLTDR
jgi:hypothetical protein